VRRYKHAANKSVEELQAATAVVDGMAKIAASVAKNLIRASLLLVISESQFCLKESLG
jgi:MinD superfamily P-loop ATPase